MADSFIRFRTLLAELFLFDQAELDFGIYRIMNAKREEIARFLDTDLLPQAREALGAVENGVPAGLEAEVFSHLYRFFRRYYHAGDFISQRRFKEGVYAIPYEGEEVKLHWANADQFYIKTGEYFRDYTFALPDHRRVHFRLADADTERNNNKTAAGQERRFVLADQEPVREEGGELVIRFVYQSDAAKGKQFKLNQMAAERICAEAPPAWRATLKAKAPTEGNPVRTVLAKHLADYTARNTFDYFIHKDLGGFLRRELDFYLKNEVVHLDDLEHAGAPGIVQHFGKVRAIRQIALPIIGFLAQLENFQKWLWLKKKFVVEANYCITLDWVPEELFPEIAANDAQRDEWVRLFAIDEIRPELARPGFSAPLTVEFLKASPFLVLDTAFFDERFRDRLLASIDDLDEQTDGLLVHGENFQALSFLRARYHAGVKTIYIDPPYNTGTDDFLYRDNYQHSSWLSMMADRLAAAAPFLSEGGLLFCSCDSAEHHRLRLLAEQMLGPDSFVESFSWIRAPNPSNLSKKTRQKAEHILCYEPSPTPAPFRGEPVEEQDSQPLYNAANARSRLIFPAGSVEFGFHEAELEPGEYGKGPVILEEPLVVQGGRNQTALVLHGPFRWRQETLDRELAAGTTIRVATPALQPRFKRNVAENYKIPDNILIDKSVGVFSNEQGRAELDALFGKQVFDYPKPSSLIKYLIQFRTNPGERVLDFFAGTGTTAHAVIDLNRDDGGRRKYLLMEIGDYFDSVLLPRIQKVVYSPDWKNGKPVSRAGSSHLLKYIRLESYEDTLNNLELRRTPIQQEVLDSEREFRRDYLLHYMLDAETRGSASLLDLECFEDPFSYELMIGAGSAGEIRPTRVDLVETFNYLLGLRVKRIDRIRGMRVVWGTSPDGERVLIIWRNTRTVSNADLDSFFQEQGCKRRGADLDVVYVNGDNNLENLRREDEKWRVRLTEQEFLSRMFDVREL